MSLATEPLPITRTLAPADQAELAAAVREAIAADTPVYPIGGGTSLDFGRVPKRAGWALSLGGLDRVVDYPARDMTVTVEAGIPMARLQTLLAGERQRLPIDAPQAERATLGGVIATNASGPRRFGHGTIRDYVIGIRAVDGRGIPFNGGGRVVKNVAGYDFCKLLCGSLGTIGVVSQVTLKIKPLPECSAFVGLDLPEWNAVEERLAALAHSAVTPTAVELLAGPAWRDDPALGPAAAGAVARVVLGLEGTAAEVAWMSEQCRRDWGRGVGSAKGFSEVREPAAVAGLWNRLTEFSAERGGPLTLQAGLLPSGGVPFVREALAIDPRASVVSRAGNGQVVVRFAEFSAADAAKTLIARLQRLAKAQQGHVVVLASEQDLTAQLQWGGAPPGAEQMRAVKRQFDPQGLLNPGRSNFEMP